MQCIISASRTNVFLSRKANSSIHGIPFFQSVYTVLACGISSRVLESYRVIHIPYILVFANLEQYHTIYMYDVYLSYVLEVMVGHIF